MFGAKKSKDFSDPFIKSVLTSRCMGSPKSMTDLITQNDWVYALWKPSEAAKIEIIAGRLNFGYTSGGEIWGMIFYS